MEEMNEFLTKSQSSQETGDVPASTATTVYVIEPV
jgi:hypothetical protein